MIVKLTDNSLGVKLLGSGGERGGGLRKAGFTLFRSRDKLHGCRNCRKLRGGGKNAARGGIVWKALVVD